MTIWCHELNMYLYIYIQNIYIYIQYIYISKYIYIYLQNTYIYIYKTQNFNNISKSNKNVNDNTRQILKDLKIISLYNYPTLNFSFLFH